MTSGRSSVQSIRVTTCVALCGDHLRRLDGNLQRGNTKHSHHESDEAAEDQDGGCLQMFEYLVFRIMANPFRSSRMPSSSEKAGLYPVRSIFSFDTM